MKAGRALRQARALGRLASVARRARRAACGSPGRSTPRACAAQVALARRVAEREHDRELVVLRRARARPARAPGRRSRSGTSRRPRSRRPAACSAPRGRCRGSPCRGSRRRASRRARSPARRPPRRAARGAPALSTTRNRHGWRFFALPARRPASRIRAATSSGSSRSAYSRASRRLATASHVSIELNRTVQVFTMRSAPISPTATDEIGDVFPEFIHHGDVTSPTGTGCARSSRAPARPLRRRARHRCRPRPDVPARRRRAARRGRRHARTALRLRAAARSRTCSRRCWSRSSTRAVRARG